MDESDCIDALEEYTESSVDLLEATRESSVPSSSWGGAEDRSRDCLLIEFLSPLLAGGTSCTCRLRGWLFFAGGGRTKINVYVVTL